MTPQKYAAGIGGVELSSQEDIKRMRELIASKAGCFFYVDVWNMSAQLALACNKETGEGTGEVIENAPVPEKVLTHAIEKAGGAVNRSGWYPINEEIKGILIPLFNEKNE